MKSIMQQFKCCYVCNRQTYLQEHHVFFGTANRKQSEKYGLKVWLCFEHHLGNEGVHHNSDLNAWLKRKGQEVFEETHTREEFISIFGKNYL